MGWDGLDIVGLGGSVVRGGINWGVGGDGVVWGVAERLGNEGPVGWTGGEVGGDGRRVVVVGMPLWSPVER